MGNDSGFGGILLNWFGSEHCESGAHCTKCRDLSGGRPFRASLASECADVTAIDFPCPQGKEWNQKHAGSMGPTIPSHIRSWDWRQIQDAIIGCENESLRDEGAAKLLQWQDEVEKSKCNRCTLNKALAAMRVWLVENGVAE